jgi:hypothetical protein
MGTSAIIMFIFGALFLWGGLAVAIIAYQRGSKRDATE